MSDQWMRQAPSGQRFYEQLLDFIAREGEGAERDWLELKGAKLDPISKSGVEKIAKFILAAANREPAKAHKYLDGHAVMLLGISPHGAVEGIRRFDLTVLDQKLAPLLGNDPPLWDLHWIDIPGKKNRLGICAITIAGPREGQLPYLCHKTSGKLVSGRIYIRAGASTREANAAEVQRLIRRAVGLADVEDIQLGVGLVMSSPGHHAQTAPVMNPDENEAAVTAVPPLCGLRSSAAPVEPQTASLAVVSSGTPAINPRGAERGAPTIVVSNLREVFLQGLRIDIDLGDTLRAAQSHLPRRESGEVHRMGCPVDWSGGVAVMGTPVGLTGRDHHISLWGQRAAQPWSDFDVPIDTYGAGSPAVMNVISSRVLRVFIDELRPLETLELSDPRVTIFAADTSAGIEGKPTRDTSRHQASSHQSSPRIAPTTIAFTATARGHNAVFRGHARLSTR